MHNLPALSGGTNRCTLQIHPDDAARLGLEEMAIVTGPGGKLEVPVEITDAIRPPRRGVTAARLGALRAGHPDADRGAAPGRERQQPERRHVAGSAVGHRGTERAAGGGRSGRLVQHLANVVLAVAFLELGVGPVVPQRLGHLGDAG